MNFSGFTKASHNIWNTYLLKIDEAKARGQIDSHGGTVLFPSILLATETRTHYIVELVGAQPTFAGLSVKRHRETSTNRYFNQFTPATSKPMIIMDAARITFARVTLSHEVGVQMVSQRFPFARLYPSGFTAKGFGAVFSFGKRFQSFAIHNSMLINHFDGAVRVKHILHLTIVAKSLPRQEYEDWLQSDMLSMRQSKEIYGVHTCDLSRTEDFILAGQFTNMYLSHFRETTIGEFLKNHPSIITQALGVQRFEYEPSFPWLDGLAGTDRSINPDLMIQRNDLAWDIYDLKTAALMKSSITKGSRKRRRFIDYVEEGVAQLAHYEEYFRYPKNAEFAWEKYGIRVDNPNLVLVVGNSDNADATAVLEACRRLKNFSIIDYDTLLQLFLSGGRIGAVGP